MLDRSPRAVKARAASRQGRLRGRRISVDERAGAVQEWLRKSRAGCPLCRVACWIEQPVSGEGLAAFAWANRQGLHTTCAW